MCKKNVLIGKLLVVVLLLLGGTVAHAGSDVFSVNFYMKPWPWPDTDTHNITLEDGNQSAGFDDWLTDGWKDIVVPWDPAGPQDPVTISSKEGATAIFTLVTARNGGAWLWDQVRTTLLGDGNADMMDGHVNSTEDADELFEMTVSDIPFSNYDVIIYLGSQEAQFFDGKGTIVFNGVQRDFTLISGAFDGTFAEILDAATPGNYILYEGLKDSSFTVQTWGDVFTHLGPCGFQLREANPELAANPDPAEEATDVLRDVVLSWTPGEFAAAVNGHTVYLSESFDDVYDGIGGITQSATSYVSGRLKFGTTYYWRVDEVNAPPASTVYQGEIWSFTTELLAYPIENVIATGSSSNVDEEAENTVDDSGVDAIDLHSTETTDMWRSSPDGDGLPWIEYEFDRVSKLHEMWVWNHNSSLEKIYGFGFKDVSIEYSADGIDYKALGTTHEFAQAPGTPGYAHETIDFAGAAAKYVRLTANSTWGSPLGGLSEVRFFRIPVHAREPYPDSGATGVDLDAILTWRAGREAATHKVSLSADEQAVIDGTAPVSTVTETGFISSPLDVGTTYYWRVDEVNDAQTPTTWQGEIWNFTTSDFIAVDDFESYNEIPFGDEGSNLVYMTWMDGYVDPPAVRTNGSTMGHTVPFEPSMERATVYDGRQSVPLYYDNSAASLSEATANTSDLAIGRDWTVGSPQTLVLWVYGATENVPQQMYVKVGNAKVLYGGDITDPSWNQWDIDLAGLGINLSNVTQLSIGLERIGGTSGSGMVLVDAIRLY